MCTCLEAHAHYVSLLQDTIACMFIDETCTRENVINAVDELRNALALTQCRHNVPCVWDTTLLRRLDAAAGLLLAAANSIEVPLAQNTNATNVAPYDPLWCDSSDDSDYATA